MPELPEVETVKRGLKRLIIRKKIVTVDFDTPKSFPNEPEQVSAFMIGATVEGVKRRAKVLLIELDTGYSLVTHLKMTGQMVYVAESSSELENKQTDDLHQTSEIRFGAGHPNDSLIHKLPDRSTRVTITFEDGSHLYFNDQRKFGWIKLVPTDAVMDMAFFQKVGPEPLEPTFTPEVFISRVRRRANTTIKAAILDQTTLAGIGNIYADEGLWGAKIHPARRVKDINDDELRALHHELIYVLRLSIEKGGSTDRNYVNAEGKKGSYITFARVFRKEGTPCQRCATTIEKTRVVGRGTHLCPHCQKEASM